MSSVQALCITWNRPILTAVTLYSLLVCFRQNTEGSPPILVFDQNSKAPTQLALDVVTRRNGRIIRSESNIGMLGAWSNLVDQAESEASYLLLLEDDWFCDSSNANWLEEARRILDSFPEVAFVKLRSLIDEDNYGIGLKEHQPWTVSAQEEMTPELFEKVSSPSGQEFFKVTSQFTGFTFNPILIRKSRLKSLIQGTNDDLSDPTPLRSGENVLDYRWRAEPLNVAAVIDGPFKHIGFHNRANFFRTLPRYVLRLLVRLTR